MASLDAARTPEGTLKLRSYHLRRFAIDAAVGPWEVTPEIIEDHIRGRDWSPNTTRSVLTTIRSFYRWAIRKRHTAEDPTLDVMPARAEIGVPRPAPDTVVRAGVRLPDERVRWMIALAAWCGLRCCEIAVVHSRDVVRVGTRWELVAHGKGRKRRQLPCPDALARWILSVDGYAFPGQKDGHLSAHYVSKLISRALPHPWTAHTLRHWYASAAYAADRDIRAVQQLLGHASVATTQIYTAVPRDSALHAAEHAYRLAS